MASAASGSRVSVSTAQEPMVILVLGDEGTGKSALISRIVDDVFLEVYEPTTEVVQRSYTRKGSGREVVFKEVPASWLDDATGADPLEQYQYEEDWKEIKRGIAGAIILFDPSEPAKHTLHTAIELRRSQLNSVPALLVGTKADLGITASVTAAAEAAVVEGAFVAWLPVSAKTGAAVAAAANLIINQGATPHSKSFRQSESEPLLGAGGKRWRDLQDNDKQCCRCLRKSCACTCCGKCSIM